MEAPHVNKDRHVNQKAVGSSRNVLDSQLVSALTCVQVRSHAFKCIHVLSKNTRGVYVTRTVIRRHVNVHAGAQRSADQTRGERAGETREKLADAPPVSTHKFVTDLIPRVVPPRNDRMQVKGALWQLPDTQQSERGGQRRISG